MKPFFVSLSLLASLIPAIYGQVSTPAAGFVRPKGLPVQAIYGVAGNLITAPAIWGPAEAICFGKSGGLIAAGGHVRLVSLDGSVLADYPTAEKHPVLGMGDTLASSIAWLPGTGTLLWVENAPGDRAAVNFHAIRLNESAFAADVTSVSRTGPKTMRFLVSQPDGTVTSVMVSAPGEIESEDVVPGLRAPAFEFNGRFIWADDRGLEIGTADGILETLRPPAAGPFQAERMSGGWIHLSFAADTSADWALNLRDSQSSLFRLPAPVAKGASR